MLAVDRMAGLIRGEIVTQAANETEALVSKASTGDSIALGRLLEQLRLQLERIVSIHLDRRLQSRVDAADVVHDAFVKASHKNFMPQIRNSTDIVECTSMCRMLYRGSA